MPFDYDRMELMTADGPRAPINGFVANKKTGAPNKRLVAMEFKVKNADGGLCRQSLRGRVSEWRQNDKRNERVRECAWG